MTYPNATRRTAVSSLLLAAAVTLLGACAAPQPRGKLAEEQARVVLETRVRDRVEAYRLDGELVDGLRFNDLIPGSHDLRVRHHFEMPGSAGGAGLLGEPQWDRCIVAVRYNDFAGGEQYVFEVERRGFRSVGWLRSKSGKKLAEAEVIRCGPAV
jgi:hypothetical protein